MLPRYLRRGRRWETHRETVIEICEGIKTAKIRSNSDCASERKQKEKYWEIEIDGRRSTSRGRGEGGFYVMEIEYIGRKEEGLK